MDYLNNFIESLRFLTKFSAEFKNSHPDFEQIKKLQLSFWENRNENYYHESLFMIKELTEKLVKNYTPENIINKCHGVSHDIFATLIKTEFAKIMAFNVTVGNVFYKSENIYNLSKKRLEKIINKGPQPDEKLDVHVWITAENMTVIDPTIMQTLSHRKKISPAEAQENSVLIWREDLESDFYYEPLLVDNNFLFRVDRVIDIVHT